MTTEPNESVYPVTKYFYERPFYQTKGLTKREDFAKAAMIGLLSAVNIKDFLSKDLCEAAVRIADELIENLNK